eukprot:5104655-Lingulodinium_polyedra.AAC.1
MESSGQAAFLEDACHRHHAALCTGGEEAQEPQHRSGGCLIFMLMLFGVPMLFRKTSEGV